MKKPELESVFSEVGVLSACNFIKENSYRGAFLRNLQTFQEKLFFEENL